MPATSRKRKHGKQGRQDEKHRVGQQVGQDENHHVGHQVGQDRDVELAKRKHKAFVMPSFLVDQLVEMLGSTPQVVLAFKMAFKVCFEDHPKLESTIKACKFAYMAGVFGVQLSLRVLDESYRSCLEVALQSVEFDPGYIKMFDPALRSDFQAGFELVRRTPWTLFHLSDIVHNDQRIVEQAVKCKFVFAALDAKWRNNKALVMQAAKYAHNMELISQELRNDEEVVRAFVDADPKAFQFANPRLKAKKDMVLYVVNKMGKMLEEASLALRNDEQVVLTAMQTYSRALAFAGPGVRQQRNVVMASVRLDGTTLEFAAPPLKQDRAIVLAAVTNNPMSLRFADECLKNDPSVVRAAFAQNGLSVMYAGVDIRFSLQFAKLAVQNDGMALRYLPTYLPGGQHREVVLDAVRQNGMAIRFAAHGFQTDLELVKTALEQNIFAFRAVRFEQFVTQDEAKHVANLLWLFEDPIRDFVCIHQEDFLEFKQCLTHAQRTILAERGFWLDEATSRTRADKDRVTTAVSLNGYDLGFASQALRSNKQVVQTAVRNAPCALQYAVEALRNDFDVVLKAVRKDGRALQYASSSLRDDDLVVAAAIHNDCEAIRYASPRLKATTWAVLAAVSQKASMLEYTSLRDSKQVVLSTVRRDGQAIIHASRKLRGDPQVVRQAILSSFRAFMHAQHVITKDKDFVLLAAHQEAKTCLTKEVRSFFISKFGDQAWEDLARSI
jgi:hypothetical protein